MSLRADKYGSPERMRRSPRRTIRPRHIGHVYEVIRTAGAIAQVTLTTLIFLHVSGVL